MAPWLGVGGLAFAFASRETLSDVFGAGILLTDRPFRRGDFVAVGDVRGTIEKVGIRSTRIRTAEDTLVVLPNGKMADATINNWGSRRHRMMTGSLNVGWGAAPDAVDALVAGIRDLIADRSDTAADRTAVGVTGLGADGMTVEFTCYLTARSGAEERAAKHALMTGIVRLARGLGFLGGVAEEAPKEMERA